MHLQYSPYAPPLILSAAISLALAILARSRRHARGVVPLTIAMLAVALFSLAYLGELLSTDVPGIMLWTRIEYIGFVILPTAWLAFAIEYTGRGYWLTRRNLTLLLIEPVLTLVMVWTNDLHGLFYTQVSIDTTSGYPMAALVYGPYFWLQGAYAYAAVLFGVLLIVREFLRSSGMYRRQTSAILFGAVLPWALNALYLTSYNPQPHLHLTVFAFTVSGITIVWALVRYGLFDVMPIARDALLDGMDDGVIVLDGLDRVVDFNAAACRMMGVPQARAIGQPIEHVVPGWPSFMDLSGAALPDGRNGNGASPGGTAAPGSPAADGRDSARREIALRRGGELFHYDVRLSTLMGRKNTLTGRLFVLRDITDRVRAEQAEREQRAFVEALRDAAAGLASILDLDSVLDRILAAAARVVPHDCGSVMLIESGSAHTVRAHDCTDQGLADSLIGSVLRFDEPANMRFMVETRQPLAIPDTARFPGWVLLPGTDWIRSHVGAPICVQGKVVGFLNLDSLTPGFFTHAHAQRLQTFADEVAIALVNAQLYSSLQKTNVQLQAALHAKDEMIQNVSHELRGPLTVLLAYLEVMSDGEMGPLNDMQQHAAEVLRGQGTKLHYMVERLLTLQSFAPEKLQRVPLDLGMWLQDTVSLWQARARNVKVRLQVEIHHPLAPVRGDPQFLGQVLDNLLDNALKFSSGGDIELRTWSAGNEVLFTVCDHGIGIPSDKLDRIFDRFYQVDGTTSRRYGGMGIGLALCRAIVEAHDGRIWAESGGAGCGTTFFVALPADGLPGQAIGDERALSDEPGGVERVDLTPQTGVA